jgi:plasmid stabilization system protein ParE
LLEEANAPDVMRLIAEAVDVLANHPLMGRSVEQGFRELVISQGKSGYVALYSYEREADVVLVLAIRHQREAGYVYQSSL